MQIRNMARARQLLCLSALLLASLCVHAREPLDRIVAVVNRAPITASELQQRMDNVRNKLERQRIEAPADEVLRQQVLDRLILEQLQQERAAQMGLRIDDNMVNQTLARIAQQNRLDQEGLRQAIAKEGMDFAQFREDIRREMLLSRLRERVVDSQIVVNDAEIDSFIQQNRLNNDKLELRVRHILVVVPESADAATRSAKQAKIEAALAALQQGESFASVATRYSEAGDALEGGDMGFRPLARYPELFARALAELKPGQFSAVLQSANGYHIIQNVEQKNVDVEQNITRTRARHILIKVNDVVNEADARVRIEHVLEKLKNGADFAETAKAYSEDATAAKGGELGWLNEGDTVPAFEQAMNALAVGQMSSEAVKSPFGWHVIKVEERKTEDAGPERERQAARMAIKTRRADVRYEDWLRELRDGAYVDVR